MNGVARFLSRRDKHHEKRSSKHSRNSKSRQSESIPPDLYTVLTNEDGRSASKTHDQKVKTLVNRLRSAGIDALKDEHAEHALSWYPDEDKAFELLVLANESFEGEMKDFHPDTTMLGAVNRNMVTCYLDALLFAMFARLDSFEAMLYDNFPDESRKTLAGILRFWVNLLRTGHLIKPDLTKHLQESLAKNGWEDAAMTRQQDASEAFTFITGALELPLLTLKMDIYHTGREDKEDDHKFINERLLEVAVPESEDGKTVILEDCLETYFNNRIEVKRYLQRQNTLGSIRSVDREPEKSQTVHIESVEVSGVDTPVVTTPTTLAPASPIRPLEGRRRTDSIFSKRYTNSMKSPSAKSFDEKKMLDEMLGDNLNEAGRPRSASLRKEVMMPAWQFFSLIPWYTDNVPQSDAQVAAHFSAKRPVLGICLKRYTMHSDGTPKRLNTHVDIPLEIGLPHFISDDHPEEQEGPLFGNFKLVLQSVVCHRGISVDSGHYISLVRANGSATEARPSSSHSNSAELSDSWLRFDDLAQQRVVEVNVTQALREESPYLLFYQVQPIDEELAMRGDPPTYAEVQSSAPSTDPSREALGYATDATAADTDVGGEWEKVTSSDTRVESVNSDEPFARSSMSSTRNSSQAYEELEYSTPSLPRGRGEPQTPDDQKPGFLSVSRRNSKTWLAGSKSRPGSQNGENRLSHTLSRLTGRGSKDKLQTTDIGAADDPVIVVNEAQDAGSGQQSKSPVKEKKDTGGLSRAKSKKEKKEEKKRLGSKSLEPLDDGGAVPVKGKQKKHPDRECVIM